MGQDVYVVEERKSLTDSKHGPWSEPVAVCLSGVAEIADWCEPYVVTNRWVQSRTVVYSRPFEVA